MAIQYLTKPAPQNTLCAPDCEPAADAVYDMHPELDITRHDIPYFRICYFRGRGKTLYIEEYRAISLTEALGGFLLNHVDMSDIDIYNYFEIE